MDKCDGFCVEAFAECVGECESDAECSTQCNRDFSDCVDGNFYFIILNFKYRGVLRAPLFFRKY